RSSVSALAPRYACNPSTYDNCTLSLHDALPIWYETRVGERGVTLSGVERQRISIARALLRDEPILILDEPTSALDPASENLMMEALHRLIRGRTTFVIAHRMSTIRRADEVLVLDHGEIIEQGSHDELVQLPRGLYRSFLQLQVGGGLPSTAPDWPTEATDGPPTLPRLPGP